MEATLESLARGRAMEPRAAAALRRLVGRDISLEGLSQLFQPRFPGVQLFVIEERVAPDQAVEVGLVGVSRSGRPVWTGSRAFVRGRDGSLEIHRGFDVVHPDFQSRNITTDVLRNELEMLRIFDAGPSARITLDAEGVGRFVFALHGFGFADASEEGPPLRSHRAFEPDGDRERLTEAARVHAERCAKDLGAGRLAIEALVERVEVCRTPWSFAALDLAEMPQAPDGALGVGGFGRSFLLHPDTPSWRGALLLRDAAASEGHRYRDAKTRSSEKRLRAELEEIAERLKGQVRAERIRALRRLSLIGPPEWIPVVKELMQSPDRRVAAVARQTHRTMALSELPHHMLTHGMNEEADPAERGQVLRILAEHHPRLMDAHVPMLRIHPDARVQRSIVPLVAAEPDPGPSLAAMLAANPLNEEEPRPGLAELRIELIEHLTSLRDPSTLPVIMEAYRRNHPSEQLALSRALVSFPDPRAQLVLAELRVSSSSPPIP
ncbi:MAG: hypothetical protein AAF627_16400 [Myxococcota bacterium]